MDLSAQFLRCMRLISVNLRSLFGFLPEIGYHPQEQLPEQELIFLLFVVPQSCVDTLALQEGEGALDTVQEARIIEPDYNKEHKLFCF